MPLKTSTTAIVVLLPENTYLLELALRLDTWASITNAEGGARYTIPSLTPFLLWLSTVRVGEPTKKDHYKLFPLRWKFFEVVGVAAAKKCLKLAIHYMRAAAEAFTLR